jgi:hypothetical protein
MQVPSCSSIKPRTSRENEPILNLKPNHPLKGKASIILIKIYE